MSKLFQEISNPALRAWNQLATLRNLEEVHGEKASSAYYEELSDAEKVNILAIGTRILVKGESFVRAEVNREL